MCSCNGHIAHAFTTTTSDPLLWVTQVTRASVRGSDDEVGLPAAGRSTTAGAPGDLSNPLRRAPAAACCPRLPSRGSLPAAPFLRRHFRTTSFAPCRAGPRPLCPAALSGRSARQ
ncbi:hypothetical protein KTU01_32070 [Kocuria turfanensis]|uniref:Uncharacterized protein n=1 Tax=Kocuria turfanensis TaxID=388357 RepID=A0A512IHC9_9MICC|nr:hypothetical protein KTU01_32070 [Kocuria turfanensis]